MHVKPSFPGLLCVGRLLNYTFNLITCDWSVSQSGKILTWFGHKRLYLSKNLSISSRLLILLAYSCLSLMILCIFAVSVVIYPFSFLIFLIWILPFLFFFFPRSVWLNVYQFCLLKESTFIVLCYCFLHFYFISAMNFLSFYWLWVLFFSSCSRCEVRLRFLFLDVRWNYYKLLRTFFAPWLRFCIEFLL